MQDLRLALRHARSSPGFFLAGVLSIAVGIGAVTAVFSIANRLLLAPLPVAGPSGLYAIRERRDGFQSDGIEGMRMPFDRYQAYRAAAGPAFAGMAAHAFTTMSLRADGDATTVNGVIASGNYFDVLGVRPGLGRLFTRDDEPAVVLSHALWQTRFGGRRDVLGRTIHLDGQPFAVAGVAPAGFDGTFPTLPAQVWVPARAYHAGEARPRGWVAPFGRLRPGVSLSSAEAYTRILAMRIPPDPDAEIRGAVLEPVTPVPEDLRQPTKTFLAILLATAGLVLLIAAVNLAGMLLARGAARRREIGVRLALGATHARVVRQLLTETLVLYAAGGGLGLGLCTLGTGLLAGYRLPVSQRVLLDYAPDYRVLGFALVLSLITGVVFGLAPALHAARADLASTLKEGERGTTRATGRSVFVAAQIALSVVLLVSAGLFARSLRRALTAELGFDPHGVATAEMDLAPHGYDETRGRGFFSQLEEAVRQLPGAESVALARLPPLSAGSMMGSMIQPAGTPDEHTSLHTSYDIVDPAFFPTVRAPIVAGRALGPQDGPGAPGVAVLNQTLARRFWPGENPIGKRVRLLGRELEVVGIARDAKYRHITESPEYFVFLPFAQRYSATMVLHARVRAGSSPSVVLRGIRDVVRGLDPDVATEPALLDDAVSLSVFPQRVAALFIGVLGLIGLGLAAMGVYTILAFQVAQRTRELGIRIALGAGAREIAGLVLRRGVLLTAVGCGVGLVAAAALTRALRSFLYGVGPLDPVTFVTVPVVLGAVALVASYLPAGRATRVDPMSALRTE